MTQPQKAQHTPGPWNVANVGTQVFIEAEQKLTDEFKMMVCSLFKWKDQTEANARLISAAPELLEALKELLEWIDAPQHTRNFLGARVTNARKLIVKAEGR